MWVSASTIYVGNTPLSTSNGQLYFGNVPVVTASSAGGNISTAGNVIANAISVTGSITGASFTGDGGFISNINGANVTGYIDASHINGTVANAAYATQAGMASSATQALSLIHI